MVLKTETLATKLSVTNRSSLKVQSVHCPLFNHKIIIAYRILTIAAPTQSSLNGWGHRIIHSKIQFPLFGPKQKSMPPPIFPTPLPCSLRPIWNYTCSHLERKQNVSMSPPRIMDHPRPKNIAVRHNPVQDSSILVRRYM